MRAILVGAGGICRQLLRRLGEMWEVTVVDQASQRLVVSQGLRPCRSVQGDGSSRVVLRRAGLNEANALVACTGDDEVNLEACRLALEADVTRIVAVANDPERLADYRDLGVSAISAASLAARRIELELETRRVASMAFANGQAEAIELRVTRDSRVYGKALREFGAYNWVVGAMLRDNQLIIPDGNTVFEAGDLVTVVAAGNEFGEIVRTFISGEGRFPLDFGKRVAIAIEEGATLDGMFSEAVHLVRNTRASSLLMIHRDPETVLEETRREGIDRMLSRASELSDGVELRPKPVPKRPSRALGSLPQKESVGVIVLAAPRSRGLNAWKKTLKAVSLVRRTGRPVLLSRGSHPYRSILVPARQTPAGRAAVRAAIDLARFAKARLHSIAVIDPVFISGPGDPVEARSTLSWIEEEAGAHGVEVNGTIEQGNPVRILREAGEKADLLVFGIAPRHPGLPTRMAIGELVARRTPRSVLFVPADERV